MPFVNLAEMGVWNVLEVDFLEIIKHLLCIFVQIALISLERDDGKRTKSINFVDNIRLQADGINRDHAPLQQQQRLQLFQQLRDRCDLVRFIVYFALGNCQSTFCRIHRNDIYRCLPYRAIF